MPSRQWPFVVLEIGQCSEDRILPRRHDESGHGGRHDGGKQEERHERDDVERLVRVDDGRPVTTNDACDFPTPPWPTSRIGLLKSLFGTQESR